MKKSLSSSSSSSPVHLLSVQPEISKPKRTRRTLNHKRPNAGRSSQFRGVTKHRWTGRFEAHLWDRNATNNQMKKGKQVYLGAYDNEVAAARTYDLAALKFWGPGTTLNFDVETYAVEIEAMKKFTRDEYLSRLRRQSSGFSRGQSKFRGVARHHHNGRWEARIGRVYGNKYLYLGTFQTQEEAAMAYDRAAIMYRGLQAVTNFEISNYLPVPHQLLNDNQPAPAPLSPPAPQTPTRAAEPIRPVSPSLTFLTLSTHTNGSQEVIGSSDYISTSELLEPEVQSAAMVDPAMGYDDSWNLCMDSLPMPNNPYGYMQFYNASDLGMAVNEDFKVEPMEGTDWFQYLNEADGFQESMAAQGGSAAAAGPEAGPSRCSCGCCYPIGNYS